MSKSRLDHRPDVLDTAEERADWWKSVNTSANNAIFFATGSAEQFLDRLGNDPEALELRRRLGDLKEKREK